LLAQPLLKAAEGKLKDKIIGRKKDQKGNVINTYHHNNPILNTTVYLAEFPNGISEYDKTRWMMKAMINIV
jgi:hypothetical protein